MLRTVMFALTPRTPGRRQQMPRNFFRRIEVVFPVLDGNLRERITAELLAVTLADNTKVRWLQSDGTYRPSKPAKDEKPRRCQTEFIALAQNEEKNHRKSARKKTKYREVKLRPRPGAS